MYYSRIFNSFRCLVHSVCLANMLLKDDGNSRDSHVLACNTHTHARTHAHPFNDLLFGTTRVSRYQKGKTNPDFTEARDDEWR